MTFIKPPYRYLAMIGQKGGAKKGPTKVRGNKEYYAALGRKSGEARRAKKQQ